ncbi:MAG: DUF362 domain-containing protein [bacterium]|nr:DUF362 domain-containing protein [bacterium]
MRTTIALAVGFLVVPAILRLGVWSPEPLGVDAVSAVTPGYIAVVGAGNTSGPGAPATPTVEDLVRGAFYLSGGLHKAIDSSAEDVLLRPGHTPMDRKALAQHVEVLRAVIVLLHDIAPEARITLLLGGVPGSGVQAQPGLTEALQVMAGDPALASVELVLLELNSEETEGIEVPDGGEAADVYPVPIVLLECDAVVNVARYHGSLSALQNLMGLAPAATGAAAADGDGYLVDMALLADVEFTILDMLGQDHPRGPVVLASADGLAVDRIAEALAGIDNIPPALTRAGGRLLGMAALSGIKVGGLDVVGTWTPDTEAAAGP